LPGFASFAKTAGSGLGVVNVTVETPFFSDHQGSFACIRTEKFIFGANAGNKLSYFGRSQLYGKDSKYLTVIKNKYAAPANQLDSIVSFLGEKERAWSE